MIDGTTAPYDATSLIENVFLGDGVELTGVTHQGNTRAIGYFSNGMDDINLDRGIMMSTGFSEDAAVPNQFFFPSSGATSGFSVSDPQLEGITSTVLEDQNIYEISFIPISDTLRFRYVFASEEYPEFVCSEFNDVFGFFIDGPRPASQGGGFYNWENIARVPDPADPAGNTFLNIPVTINTVNNGIQPGGNTAPVCDLSYDMYFNSVGNGDLPVYNGYLDVFIAEAVVIPCQEYTIKLGIGDGGDNIYDSAVFLEAKSFGTPSLNLVVETESLDGGVAEGCDPATLTFNSPITISANLDLDFNILTTGLSVPIAENGIDYLLLDDDLEIAAGETAVSFELVVLDDAIIEGEEFFVFDYQRDICNRDTIYIRIVENDLESPVLPDDMNVCRGESQLLDSEFPPSFMIPDPPTYSNTQEILIDQNDVEFYSDITVTGMVPEFLNAEVIKEICIDTLIHITPYDLDLYLLTPGGQILELSTDNGWRGPEPDLTGLNFMQVDTFLNTCFSVNATRPINNGNAIKGDIYLDTETYTGSFLPEGIWDDLWDGDNPTNGTYRLLIIDDDPGFNTGVLKSWSICFSSVYDISFEWSADPPGSLSCIDCEDPTATPLESTTYYLTTRDSYGCEEIDSVQITVLDTPLEPQNIVCNETALGQLTFSWEADAFATYYEISIDGGVTWVDIGTDLFYVIDGLNMSMVVDFWVRGGNLECPGEIGSLLCSTGNCDTPTITTMSLSDVSCVGLQDGAFTINAAGSSCFYNYNFETNINQTGIFTNVMAGDYVITITDDVDCTVEYNISIEEPNAIIGNALTLNEISCFGDTDGSLTFEVSGGTGPYQFNWSDGQTDSIAINLEADDYFVTVTDANNCDEVFTSVLTEEAALNIVADEASSVSCNGLGDGIATVNITGGLGPYSYLWEDGETTDSLFNVGQGNYLVVVTDANMCTTFVEVSITEPDPLDVILDIDNPSCFENADGMLSANVSGGTNTYSYLWNNGQETTTIENLNAGNYTVTVTDENLCTFVQTQELIAPNEINIAFNISQISCFDSATGEIDINVTGGDDDFGYSWQGTNSGQIFQTEDLNNLIADEYCVTVTDGNMCTKSLCTTLVNPDEILVTDIVTNAGCNGGTDGGVDIEISGGNGPYVVVWTGASSPNNEDLVNVAAGTYSVQITDSDNCSYTDSYEVMDGSSLTVSESIIDVACKDEFTGSINLTINGGTNPYIITWTGPNNYMSSDPSIFNLEDGTYNLTVTDQNSCSITASYNVNEPLENFEVELENDIVCSGNTDGFLSVVATGGTVPYNYVWSNGEMTSSIGNLPSGNYAVTVTDDSNCVVLSGAEVVVFDDAEIFASSVSTSCFDLNDGTASVDSVVANGVLLDLSQLQYSWNSIPAQNTQQVFNLPGGSDYFVTVTDQNGCASTTSVFVDRPDALEVQLIDSGNALCFNGQEGFVELMGVGGTAPYSYEWSLNAGTQTDSLALSLGGGQYIVTVTDANNCTTTAQYDLSEPDEIITEFIATQLSCFDDNDGSVDLQLSGGIAPYDISWSTGEITPFIDSLVAGLYYVTITDSNLCEIVDSVLISQTNGPLSFTFDVQDVSCFGGFDGSISIFPEGGNGLYMYSLDGENYSASSVLIGLEAGNYTIYVQDQNGCESVLPEVIVNEPLELTISIGTFKEVEYGQSIQMFLEIMNGVGDLMYSWTSSSIGLFNCDNCLFPTIENVTQDVFTTFVVTDENGCTAEVQITIITVLENFIDVPTGFTPDGDGVNDLLNVYGKSGILIKEFNIYDRWGEKVYQAMDFNTNDTSIGWDGKLKGEPMNPALFVWTAEVENIDGSTHFYNGSTTLIR